MDEQAPGLRDVWRMLVGHRALIATVTAAMLAASVAFTLTQPKVYTASARLLVKPPLNGVVLQTLGSSGRNVADLTPQDIARLIDSSTAISTRVAKARNLDNTPEQLLAAVGAKVLSDTLIEVTATAQKPTLARDLANTFPRAYLDDRHDTVVAQITTVRDQIASGMTIEQNKVAELNDSVRTLNGQIALLSPPGIVLSADQAATKARLIAQRDQANAQIDQLSSQLSDEDNQIRQLNVGIASVSAGEIVKEASAPKSPSSPKPAINLAVGLLLGLIAGIVAAYLRHHFDRRVRTRDDAARTSGAPVLAAVPALERMGAPSADTLVSISAPASAAAEQYRTLRANLAAQGLGSSIRALLVASPAKGEGKSSTVANLAVACANSGLKTLAVSADPRRPTLHAFFEVPDAPGLPEVLRGHAPLSAAIFMTRVPNLYVLPSRPDPATGSDLLASHRLQEVLAEAAAHADIVLVDVTSIADGADVSILARLVGNCLLVVEADRTDRHAVARATTTIAHAGARIVGTVLNRARQGDETAGVPDRSGDRPVFDFTANGHKLPEPPLVLTRPWGDRFTPPRGLPSPRPPSGAAGPPGATWEGEEE
ncbi:MAG TPA: polysaccharide biosynthesis tyrosine autokinase [Actinomycetes bacterium]|nr:polysaccharide biosynthesis tyrosine autokinase [Actinomycetes bacterium]